MAALIISVGAYNAGTAAASGSSARGLPNLFSCFALECGIPPHGAFPHLVVGRVVAIADAGQAKALFNGMRQRGHWSKLPANSDLFWKSLQPVAIGTGRGAVFVTLTSQEEMHAAPLHVGDFVRYSPHRGQYEVPPADKVAAAYWTVDGCVAILCRAGDHACFKRYRSGVYRTTDGAQLSSGSLMPLQQGITIDTETMVPRTAAEVN